MYGTLCCISAVLTGMYWPYGCAGVLIVGMNWPGTGTVGARAARRLTRD